VQRKYNTLTRREACAVGIVPAAVVVSLLSWWAMLTDWPINQQPELRGSASSRAVRVSLCESGQREGGEWGDRPAGVETQHRSCICGIWSSCWWMHMGCFFYRCLAAMPVSVVFPPLSLPLPSYLLTISLYFFWGKNLHWEKDGAALCSVGEDDAEWAAHEHASTTDDALS